MSRHHAARSTPSPVCALPSVLLPSALRSSMMRSSLVRSSAMLRSSAVLRSAAVLSAAVLSAAVLSTPAWAAKVDPAASAIGFTLKTRWGQTLQGVFPRHEGEIATLADGRHQVRLRMSTRDVEILGNPGYTRLTRGPGFFDAERFGQVVFVSDAYPAELMRGGGPLAGELTIRGRQQREVFTLRPATCARPAVDCDVVAAGSIRRGDYGVDRWSFALSELVRFSLRVRVQGDLGP